MIKSIRTIMKQDKERYKVPRKVQDVIPIRRIWPDGIFQVGNKFTKMYRFTDINYLVASREDKESMFLTYSELLNSLDSGATTKLTIYNHRQNRASFEKSILMPMKEDGLDQYRKEYNQMLLDKIEKRGMTTEGMEQYLAVFKYGMPPHGGLGIGLERLTMKLVGEDNVRETTLFPRDLSRLEP